MNEKVAYVFHGWLQLSAKERNELVETMGTFEKLSQQERERLKTSVRVILETGVSPCPCCTKSYPY